MKKKPTMKRATMARFMSEKESVIKMRIETSGQLTNSSHLLSVEVVGDAIFVRNVVVKVAAPGLDRAHVQVKGWTLRGLGLLSRVALPEEPPGPCEVEGGVRDLGH